MTKKTTLTSVILALFLFLSFSSYAQKETVVSGTVKDAVTGEPIAGATIIVKGKIIGASTNLDGNFNFGITLPPPFILMFSAVDYQTREYEIIENNQVVNVNLRTLAAAQDDIVLTATQKEESLMRSPVSIAKRGLNAIEEFPAANFYEGIADLQGVQMNHSSLTFQSINTRGFANIDNTRFLQVVDGVDNTLPGLNFALGNFGGVAPLDIAEIELVPGASSATYGPNAFNGVLSLNTKSPFDYEGLSVMLQNGVTVQDAAGTNPFIQMGVRYAKAFNDVWGFKLNVSTFKGTDWHANDFSDLDTESIINPDKGKGINPAYNGVNIYGDEIVQSIDLGAFGGPDTTIRVARTGYNEADLTDYQAQTLNVSAAVHYRLTETIQIIGSYSLGVGNTVYQGANRYAFKGASLQNGKLEIKGENFSLKGYTGIENAGNTYDMRFLSWNLNRAASSDENWFQDYTLAYLGARPGIDSFNHTAARSYADRNRLVPGTDTFDNALSRITALQDLKFGAKFVDRSRFYHAEMLYNATNDIEFMTLILGGNYRAYSLNSEGSLFNDASAPIRLDQYAAFAQLGKGFVEDRNGEERLNLNLAIRYDKQQNFDGQISPRASVVYSLGNNFEHNFRASFQTGFRNPEMQAQYLALDLGVTRLLGGIQSTVENYLIGIPYTDNLGAAQIAEVSGTDVYDDSYSLSSVLAYSAAVEKDVAAGENPILAAQNNSGLLQTAQLNFIKQERVSSYEIGYRGILGRQFFLDLTYFYNSYDNFLSTTNVIHPLVGSTRDSSSLTGLGDLIAGRTANFQVYTNADGKVLSQGVTVGIDYALNGGFRLGGNFSYTDFDLGTTNPDLVPGFNTPKYRYMISFSNDEVYKGFGFFISHRWSDGYDWQSPFGNGQIDPFSSTNVQVNYDIPNSNVRLKLGGTNVFQTEYRTSFGAPNVGAKYFVSLTYNEF